MISIRLLQVRGALVALAALLQFPLTYWAILSNGYTASFFHLHASPISDEGMEYVVFAFSRIFFVPLIVVVDRFCLCLLNDGTMFPVRSWIRKKKMFDNIVACLGSPIVLLFYWGVVFFAQKVSPEIQTFLFGSSLFFVVLQIVGCYFFWIIWTGLQESMLIEEIGGDRWMKRLAEVWRKSSIVLLAAVFLGVFMSILAALNGALQPIADIFRNTAPANVELPLALLSFILIPLGIGWIKLGQTLLASQAATDSSD